MTHETNPLRAFALAAGYLPEALWRAAYTLEEPQKLQCEEFRLRAGQPFCALVGGKILPLPLGEAPLLVSAEDLAELVARCTANSVHTYSDQLAQGYVSLDGGHRLGVCGESLLNEQGRPGGFRSYSGANLRIARQITALAQPLLPYLMQNDQPLGTLLLSPPGGGKTTLLRELVRCLAQTHPISLLDERGEIAACRNGMPQFDVGPNTDILSGCPKRFGLDAMVRAMGPQLVALDEITSADDAEAMLQAQGCGCQFFATAHGKDLGDLRARPSYRPLLEQGIFQRFILIEAAGGQRHYRIFRQKEDLRDAMVGGTAAAGGLHGGGDFEQLYAGAAHSGAKILCGSIAPAAI